MDTAAAPARLIVHNGDASNTIALDPLPFTIGRHADHHLSLNNSQVSRQHAVIHRDRDGYYIQDLGSSQGTYINGVRQQTARLSSCDRIELGSSGVVLVFLLQQDQLTTRTIFTRIATTAPAASELENLSLFLQAAQSLNSTQVLDDVLSTLLDYTLRLTGAERGFVFLGDSAPTLHLRIGRASTSQPLTDDSDISRSILTDAARSGEEFIIGDVSGDGQPIGRESFIAHELRSVIAIPLRGRSSSAHLLGVLYLDSRLRTSTLNRVSRDILSAIASESSNLIENARMVEAERAADLLRNELSIAASIQQSILPRELPVIPGIAIHARTIPSTQVGGDFYDIIQIPEDSGGGFVAIVADVSGKGISAALLAAIVQGMIYAQIKGGIALADAFAAANNFLCSRVSGQKYVTMLALRYRPSGQVELVNGGHVPPYLVLPDSPAQPIPDGDVPVGLLPGAVFHSIAMTLPPHARLVLLSDGITETEDPSGDQFSETELIAQLAANDPVDAIFAAVHRFSAGAPLRDDCTILVIDRTA
jgi:serine phosphatase RsbU (regulator of sigma subunit)